MAEAQPRPAGEPTGPTGPLGDLREEAPRVLDALTAAGLRAAAVGGLAVWLCCPSARRPPLERPYKDLDLVAAREEIRPLTRRLAALGYRADEEFNALHGSRRLFFWDDRHDRQLDVFVETMHMCHVLELGDRLGAAARTLPPADLLLAKLQVVEVNEKDLQDAAALLADHPIAPEGIDPARVAGVLAADWGWWRTATGTLDRVLAYAGGLAGLAEAETVAARGAELRERVDAEPKSRRWKLRARVGERVRWFELPEEIEG